MNDEKRKQTAARVDSFDRRLSERGGRRLNGIRLDASANAALEAIKAETGESTTAVINKLLSSSVDQTSN